MMRRRHRHLAAALVLVLVPAAAFAFVGAAAGTLAVAVAGSGGRSAFFLPLPPQRRHHHWRHHHGRHHHGQPSALAVSRSPRIPGEGTADDDDNDNDNDGDGRRRHRPSLDDRTDPRSFLLQRSVAVLLAQLYATGDGPSQRYLEQDVLGAGDCQRTYHGTGAGYLGRMGGWRGVYGTWLAEHTGRAVRWVPDPAHRRRSFRGGSRNNPYTHEWAEAEAEADEDGSGNGSGNGNGAGAEGMMRVVVDPLNLLARLLDVQDRMTAELSEDLRLLYGADRRLLVAFASLGPGQAPSSCIWGCPDDGGGEDGYSDASDDFRSGGLGGGRASASASASSDDGDGDDDDDDGDGDGDGDDECALLCDSELMGSVPTLASLHASLVDGAAEAPSPHRADTFDLLLNLITQASVHLLLRQLQDAAGMGPPPGGNGSGGPAAAAAAAAAEAEARARRGQQGRGGEADASQARAAFVWLRRYYSDRVGRCFDGSVGRGMADSFLREWAEMPSPALTTPPPPPPPRYTLPSLDGDGDGGDPPPSVQPDVSLDAPVRPLDLAERMVRIRSEVALRWRREGWRGP